VDRLKHPESVGQTAAVLIGAGLLFWAGAAPGADGFIAGADMSHLAFFEDRGVVYREDGRVRDALEILQQRGVKVARLRLFTSSAPQAQADPYNYTNNLDYTLPLAVRVKRAGLQFLLDFHYSDTWADPGKQAKPAAWASLTFAQLEAQMYQYNREVIAAFKAGGAMPDYVQIGNEITSGMLWPDGRVGGAYDVPQQWSQLGRLINAAARGIRDAASPDPPPRIVIHIDRGGDWSGTLWFFDGLLQQQVEFDLIGQSYYPWWHGSLEALANCLTNAATRYAKPVMVVETAFPWTTNGAPIVGISPGTNGQIHFLIELARILNRVPNGQGRGLFWWGTEYQALPGVALAGFDTRSFFDRAGNVLPVAEALGQTAVPVKLQASFTDEGLLLQWPLSAAGMTLTTSAELGPSPTWLPVTRATWSTGLVFRAVLPASPGYGRFFRLQSD